MTTFLRPHTGPQLRELHATLTAVDRAYDHLMSAQHVDASLLQELSDRAHALTEAADREFAIESHARSARIRRRCTAADRGAEWIRAHCR